MKTIPLFRILFAAACAASLVVRLSAADMPREHLSLDANWKFHLGDDWQAQPIFDIKKFVHAGDNVIAVGVNNGVGQGGLNPNVTAKIIGNAGVPPWSRSLFNGLAQVIVQSTRDAGEIKLTAVSDGLQPATSVLNTQPCPPPPSLP